MTTHKQTRVTRGLRLGQSVLRPDGVPKVRGRFSFSSDLSVDGVLWGATLRSPHSSARIHSIDVSAALAMSGVTTVVTAEDVPGIAMYGQERRDQPVFAHEVVRYVGEPVAAVAADHPETARRARDAIVVDYERLEPMLDSQESIGASDFHPDGNIFRELHIRHGDPKVEGDVVVEGTYEIAMQDQAFLGTEAGLAVPTGDGGVELFVPSQWLHVDQVQIAACLGLSPERVRLVLSGVGGAFGGREDLTLQIHLGLLALRAGRPVRMSFSREESFLAHVHRHPARIHLRHHADSDGNLVKVEGEVILDGGAYLSTSRSVIMNATVFAAGPYRVPNAFIDGYAARTNNPPAGAMRGFGCVQACFAHESQMDLLAEKLGIDPVELRLQNALSNGDRLITGQVVAGAAPVREVIRSCADHPAQLPTTGTEYLELPGGAGRTTEIGDVRLGVGFAVGIKNMMYSEGFDDYSTARCTLIDGVATIYCAAVEVGQGFITIAQQICGEVLGVDDPILNVADTDAGDAGSTSASRQTWMSGGAINSACCLVREEFLSHVAETLDHDVDELHLRNGEVVATGGRTLGSIAELSKGHVFDHRAEFHHASTEPLDDNGQGDAFVAFAFAAHRATVEVDPELGLTRIVNMTTSQDVGRVLNPIQARGQVEGGIAQGVGLALMEELQLDRGRPINASFADYLIPTALDMPPVTIAALIEDHEPSAPLGAKGIGELPTVSSTPAIVAAIRAATGIPLRRVPVRPVDIALGNRKATHGRERQ